MSEIVVSIGFVVVVLAALVCMTVIVVRAPAPHVVRRPRTPPAPLWEYHRVVDDPATRTEEKS